ncbi:IS66 family transposase [Nitrolancea hollandica]|uniref:Transposase IS66 central domain-containing protein n=1 Tax=Nitrolancea hollandica Lb TaxID=1129897 RepID=I4EJE1_9BACT|nr:hypothetical protein NITHO_3980002 [Nitrolancea hollandica Lb]
MVHADEPGWREKGGNGWHRTVSTPGVRHFHYDRSRAGAVVEAVLGTDYRGTLVSDCYSAYNIHVGSHQRCWVHLLHDIHDLCVAHPEDSDLAVWAQAVHPAAAQLTGPLIAQRWLRECSRRCCGAHSLRDRSCRTKLCRLWPARRRPADKLRHQDEL